MCNKEKIYQIIEEMTIEEKVAQLFITTPEALAKQENTILHYSPELEKALADTPIGGLIYFGRNLSDPTQISDLLSKTQHFSSSISKMPLFQCIDEEGGRVSKVANHPAFEAENKGTPHNWGLINDSDLIKENGKYIGHYLSKLGFNVDFAPCADVLTNPDNTVIGDRAYSNDPIIVSNLAIAFAQGLLSEKVIPSLKHFPGHGNTDADSHYEYAYTNKSLDELIHCEITPFAKGIEENIPMIMSGHISLPNVTINNEPASMSKEIITDLLRNKLGYDGIVISDSLKMKAISDIYSSKEAAIKVIKAGSDIVLRPYDFYEAYYGVVDAVKSGEITESRIEESLRRVMRVKSMLV